MDNLPICCMYKKVFVHPHDYTSYNAAILSCAEETALVAKGKCEGWYYHSQDTLTPTLAASNKVLYAMRATKLAP